LKQSQDYGEDGEIFPEILEASRGKVVSLEGEIDPFKETRGFDDFQSFNLFKASFKRKLHLTLKAPLTLAFSKKGTRSKNTSKFILLTEALLFAKIDFL
jgi:hypothetical protein